MTKRCTYVYPDGFRCRAVPLSGSWLCLYHDPEYSSSLRGAHVWIFPDNDEESRRQAEHVAKTLSGKAKSVKVMGLRSEGE